MRSGGLSGGFVSARARADFDTAYDRGMRALPEPDRHWDVRTGFGSARVYRFGSGDGPPLVLLPGRAGTVVMWEPNLRALAARAPVYAVDLIGEPGRSEQTAPIRSGADQASWLADVLSELDLSGVHLVGYSFGGWLAANLAVRRPERLASLTVLDPVQTFARFPAALIVRSALTVVPGIRGRARESFLRWMSGDADAAAAGSDDPVVRVIDEGMRSYRIALPTPTLLTGTQLRRLHLPVLALIAGRSVIHDAGRAADRARRLLPHARVEVWPSATHAIAGEFPDDVSTRIRTFLDDLEAAP
ncbi:putative hydrolase or acyltransferase of alpha/beta superfamily [Prauserella sp. Am3]|nr:putative hydrolase or acyltransferase of alpha/beta superfamily [Prauserella sp. Am3]